MLETKTFILIIFGYLLGSIAFGLILSKLKKVDIRTQGSGNIGATNVARVIGKKLGILTLILDSLKGVVAVAVAKYFGADQNLILITAASSVVGHIFPIWLNFKGGKGIATGIAVIFACNYKIGLFICAVFLIIFIMSRIVSLASIISFTLAPIYCYIFETKELFYFTIFISILVLIKHSSNIMRILNGTESKLK